MRVRSGLLLLLPLGFLPLAYGNAQSPDVSESVARQHLIEHPDPIYPPIAKAAGVHGDVVIQIAIGANGAVASEKVISGPAMLQQAALDAVKTWRFSPFQGATADSQTIATLAIPFQIDKPGEGPTPEQQKAAQALFPLQDKCRTLLKSQDAQNAVLACKQALDMSLQAGDLTTSDQLGRLNSHQLYGHALLAAGRAADALEQESLAIQEAKKCLTSIDEEYGMPFFWRAMAEAKLGRVETALNDFETAENTHRKAIQNLPKMRKTYGKYLAMILTQHAALLDQIGRPKDAERLRTEVDSL